MRFVILLSILVVIILSCSSTQETKKIDKAKCFIAMDTLTTSINHSQYGLYSIQLDMFDITPFEKMTDHELILKGLPLKKEEQKKHLFIAFLKRLRIQIKSSDCSKTDIETALGIPTKTYIKNLLGGNNITEYRLNSGFECPNCNSNFRQLFESCDHIRFYFKEKELVDFTFDIFYTGLKN